MNSKQAKEIPLEDFMNRLGCIPVKQAQSKLWYISPLRNETTPSFQLDLRFNSWYDFGEGKGGTIIDLVVALYNDSIKQALSRLESVYNFNIPSKQVNKGPFNKNQQPLFYQEQEYTIDKISSLETGFLIEYLKSRKINIDIAKNFIQEISYTVKKTNYKAIAFKNNSEGFEVRNKNFKGGLLKKDITTLNIKKDSSLYLFEGFIDFLSFLTYYKITSLENFGTVIILNSISLKNKAIEEIKKIQPTLIYFLLNNDEGGINTAQYISNELQIDTVNKNDIYKDFNDFNEFLKHIYSQGDI